MLIETFENNGAQRGFGDEQIKVKLTEILDNNPQREQAVAAAKHAFRFDHPESIDLINDALKENGSSNRLVKVPPKKRAERRELTNRLVEKLTNRGFDRRLTEGTLRSDHGERYPHLLMMKHGEQYIARNEEISRLIKRAQEGDFRNPVDDATRKDRQKFIDYHREMLENFQQHDHMEVASKNFTDKELVDRFDDFYDVIKCAGNFENINSNMKSWGISDPYCDSILKAYEPHSDFYSRMNQRYSAILDNAYEYIDPTDPQNIKTLTEMNDVDLPGIPLYDNLVMYGGAIGNGRQFIYNPEINTAKDYLLSCGVEPENMYFQDPDTKEVAPVGGATPSGKSVRELMAAGKEVRFGDRNTIAEPNADSPSITIKGNENMEYTRAWAQGKLAEKMISGIKKPTPPGFFAKIADLFGTPKNKLKYERELAEYNSKVEKVHDWDRKRLENKRKETFDSKNKKQDDMHRSFATAKTMAQTRLNTYQNDERYRDGANAVNEYISNLPANDPMVKFFVTGAKENVEYILGDIHNCPEDKRQEQLADVRDNIIGIMNDKPELMGNEPQIQNNVLNNQQNQPQDQQDQPQNQQVIQ